MGARLRTRRGGGQRTLRKRCAVPFDLAPQLVKESTATQFTRSPMGLSMTVLKSADGRGLRIHDAANRLSIPAYDAWHAGLDRALAELPEDAILPAGAHPPARLPDCRSPEAVRACVRCRDAGRIGRAAARSSPLAPDVRRDFALRRGPRGRLLPRARAQGDRSRHLGVVPGFPATAGTHARDPGAASVLGCRAGWTTNASGTRRVSGAWSSGLGVPAAATPSRSTRPARQKTPSATPFSAGPGRAAVRRRFATTCSSRAPTTCAPAASGPSGSLTMAGRSPGTTSSSMVDGYSFNRPGMLQSFGRVARVRACWTS